jgi:hypothetical protein
MTIKEYVLNSENKGINQWLEQIKKDHLLKHQDLIIKCADQFNKITINENANFINSLN